MTDLTAHFLIFSALLVGALTAVLTLGRLVRPKLPTAEKDSIYECGEPTIGSSYIQFDMRYYVVALLFIVFDVEVAFFFPWASVFGSAAQLADPNLSTAARTEISAHLLSRPELTAADAITADSARGLMQFALVDILIFFGVLLVGFAYVWKRGDIDWVKTISREPKKSTVTPTPRAELAASAH